MSELTINSSDVAILLLPRTFAHFSEEEQADVVDRIKRQIQWLGSQKPEILRSQCLYCEQDSQAMELAKKWLKSAGLPASLAMTIADPNERFSFTEGATYCLLGHDSLLNALPLTPQYRQKSQKNAILVLLRQNNTQESVTLFDCGRLPKGCPYPNSRGNEWRKRPPYYYRQAGTLPVRLNNGQLEVLLITSSKNKHWGIPKGIIEPGLSEQQTAIQESQEEAGINGTIRESLARVSIKKWGAMCQLEIFLMTNIEVCSWVEWQEDKRNRHWCQLDLAKLLVKGGAIKTFIEQLDEALLIEKVKHYE